VIRTEKLTISIPRDLAKVTDEIAKEKKITRSKLVVSCLKEMVDKRLEARMVQGYKATSKASLDFAESNIALADEILNKE
jgi:metal-responsive CopG/Arc/MetJ family transcriptional regulator